MSDESKLIRASYEVVVFSEQKLQTMRDSDKFLAQSLLLELEGAAQLVEAMREYMAGDAYDKFQKNLSAARELGATRNIKFC